MSHWQRAALLFIAFPVMFVAMVYVNDWFVDLVGKHWWDPWVGGFCMLVMFAVLCWELTR